MKGRATPRNPKPKKGMTDRERPEKWNRRQKTERRGGRGDEKNHHMRASDP